MPNTGGYRGINLQGRYWPAPPEPPRLADGTIDIRALCRMWDEEANAK